MNEITLLNVSAAALFFAGLATLATARNLLKSIMGFQVMLFGVNLVLFTAGLSDLGPSNLASTLVVLSIVLGASVEAVGLSIVIFVYRQYHTLNPWEVRRLRH